MLRCCVPFLTALVALFAASSSQAALVIDIGDLTLAPGGTGVLTVLISSDEDGTRINYADFAFSISTGGATRLEFTDPQPDPQLANANYVFSGNSFDTAFGIPVGFVSTVNVPNDTFNGGDSVIDYDPGTGTSATDVPVTGPSSLDPAKILVQLQVTAVTSLPPVVGDTFTIELTSASFTTLEGDGINFSSDLGTVTIVAAVPEPASWVVLLGLTSLAGFLWRKPGETRPAA